MNAKDLFLGYIRAYNDKDVGAMLTFFHDACVFENILGPVGYPVPDHVRSYLLGFDGVRVVDAEISAVEKPGDKYSAMWAAGQGVLTELRLLTEKK